MFSIEQSSRARRGILNRHRPAVATRKTKRIATTAAVIAAALLGAATPSALADTSALGLGCFVDSPAFDVVQADECEAQHPALQYTVRFEVLGRSAGAYSYNWHTPVLTPVLHGCTPSSYFCVVRVPQVGSQSWTRTVSADVTELATGATKTVTATASGEPVCGQLYFC